jgi:hypothetical protein
MLKTIVITDLTQMPNPDGVCVVGVDQRNQCIRPVLTNGVLKRHLYIGDKLVIRPGAKIKFDFYRVPIEPPHIEDLGFEPGSIVYEGLCTEDEWEKMLRDSSFSKVDDIYDGLLQGHRWVEPGANTRSIGTLLQVRGTAAKLTQWSGKLRYRLSFVDNTGFAYDNIPVSDLAFREFSYTEVKKRNRSPTTVSEQITSLLTSAERLYLRLGLARPWTKPNTGKLGCWMQVTGIYSFPDYLEGKSFADF